MTDSTARRKDSLKAILDPLVEDKALIDVLVALGEGNGSDVPCLSITHMNSSASFAISKLLAHYTNHTLAGSQNTSGDDQLHLDLDCDQAVKRACQDVIHTLVTEETPTPQVLKADSKFLVACDPLDGSSIVEANFAVGSLFAIFDTIQPTTGRDQMASAVTVYGPRTLICMALPPNTAIEVTLVDGVWMVSQDQLSILPQGKIFAPGNLRETIVNPSYARMVDYWMSQKYQLRYTGGMVPDVYHILAKQKGIYTTVAAKPKLRLWYEVAPLGLLMECAGGKALDPATMQPVLDVPFSDVDQRCGCAMGSSGEVDLFERIMKGETEE